MEWKKKTQKIPFRILLGLEKIRMTQYESHPWFGRHLSVSPRLLGAVASNKYVTYRPRRVLWRDRAHRVWAPELDSVPPCWICKLRIHFTSLCFGTSSVNMRLQMKAIHIHKTSGRILTPYWPSINYISFSRRCMLFVFMHIRLFKALILMCWLKHLPCYSIIIPCKEPGHSHFIHFPVVSFF